MSGLETGVKVRGLRELQTTCAAAGKQAKKDLTEELRSVAEPIRADAAALAVSGIPKISLKWSQMRVGVTKKSVYVAPKPRGAKGGPRRRPKFADLLEREAMSPALKRNEAMIETRVEAVFDRLADKWNR